MQLQLPLPYAVLRDRLASLSHITPPGIEGSTAKSWSTNMGCFSCFGTAGRQGVDVGDGFVAPPPAPSALIELESRADGMESQLKALTGEVASLAAKLRPLAESVGEMRTTMVTRGQLAGMAGVDDSKLDSTKLRTDDRGWRFLSAPDGEPSKRARAE